VTIAATRLTRRQLEDALVAWVQLVLVGGSVVIGWPNATRPLPLPYVTLRIIGIASIGQDDRGAVDSVTGLQTIYGDRLVTVSVQAFSPMQGEKYSGLSALDVIRALKQSLAKESVIDVLLQSGLATQMPGPINDLSQFLETAAEERAHFDASFGVKDLDTDLVGWIQHFAGDGTVRRDTGSPIRVSFTADV
jgi:hypothetical protein